MQIEGNKQLNLFFEQLDGEFAINGIFKEKIIELKRRHNVDIAAMIDLAAKFVLHRLYMINQFLQLSSDDIQKLKSMYYDTYTRIDSENFEAVMKMHFQQLSSWIKKFYPAAFPKALKNSSRIGSVINEEYTVALIKDIYKFNFSELKEPIIDIGCGRHALLVKEILALNKNAYGIDRLLNYSDDRVMEISWFDFQFKKKTWGTIFANMSFSNNLLYSMKFKEDSICKYYLKFKEIIESLRTGGIFYYAPSLMFIEERLDARYSIERTMKEGISITKITALD